MYIAYYIVIKTCTDCDYIMEIFAERFSSDTKPEAKYWQSLI